MVGTGAGAATGGAAMGGAAMGGAAMGGFGAGGAAMGGFGAGGAAMGGAAIFGAIFVELLPRKTDDSGHLGWYEGGFGIYSFRLVLGFFWGCFKGFHNFGSMLQPLRSYRKNPRSCRLGHSPYSSCYHRY